MELDKSKVKERAETYANFFARIPVHIYCKPKRLWKKRTKKVNTVKYIEIR